MENHVSNAKLEGKVHNVMVAVSSYLICDIHNNIMIFQIVWGASNCGYIYLSSQYSRYLFIESFITALLQQWSCTDAQASMTAKKVFESPFQPQPQQGVVDIRCNKQTCILLLSGCLWAQQEHIARIEYHPLVYPSCDGKPLCLCYHM